MLTATVSAIEYNKNQTIGGSTCSFLSCQTGLLNGDSPERWLATSTGGQQTTIQRGFSMSDTKDGAAEKIKWEILRIRHKMAGKRSANHVYALRAVTGNATYSCFPSSIPGHPGYACLTIKRGVGTCQK